MNLLEQPNGLIVLDVDRRTYVALSRDGSYYHLIQPLTKELRGLFDYEDDGGQIVSPVAVGDLICTCAGGRYRRNCYRLEQARAYEQSIAEEARWGLEAVPA